MSLKNRFGVPRLLRWRFSCLLDRLTISHGAPPWLRVWREFTFRMRSRKEVAMQMRWVWPSNRHWNLRRKLALVSHPRLQPRPLVLALQLAPHLGRLHPPVRRAAHRIMDQGARVAPIQEQTATALLNRLQRAVPNVRKW